MTIHMRAEGHLKLPGARPDGIRFDPAKSALVVVDMQNAYASQGGYLDIAGFDLTGVEGVIARISGLVREAREADRLGLENVRAFQVHLVSTGISWPALNQRVCALRFFYGVTLGHAEIPERIVYARSPRTLPVVLSAHEVVHFLEAVPSLKTRTALTTALRSGSSRLGDRRAEGR